MKSRIIDVTQKDELKEVARVVLAGKNVNLTQPVQQKIERAKLAYDFGVELRTTKRVQPHFIRRSIAKKVATEYGISLSSAYRVYHDACELFGLDEPINSREINFKLLLEELDDDMEAARQAEDWKSVATMHKTKLDTIKNMPNIDASKIASMPFPEIFYDFSPAQLRSKVVQTPEELDELEAKLIYSINSGKSAGSIKKEMIELLDEAEYEDA
jgi:hypothetical protein